MMNVEFLSKGFLLVSNETRTALWMLTLFDVGCNVCREGDYDRCARCILARGRGCEENTHNPQLQVIQNHMISRAMEFPSISDLIQNGVNH